MEAVKGIYPFLTGSGEPLWSASDKCSVCRSPVLATHVFFIFYHSPSDLEEPSEYNRRGQEWRPCPETPDIPEDNGPNRVAYWLHGEPQVQVHEGANAGQWTPWSHYTVTRNGLPYQMWLCRRSGPANPCDGDFMEEIST